MVEYHQGHVVMDPEQVPEIGGCAATMFKAKYNKKYWRRTLIFPQEGCAKCWASEIRCKATPPPVSSQRIAPIQFDKCDIVDAGNTACSFFVLM